MLAESDKALTELKISDLKFYSKTFEHLCEMIDSHKLSVFLFEHGDVESHLR